MVSELVLKTFGFKKVLESVSKKIVIKKSIKFGIGKSFGFGFVQILGIVTHWKVTIPSTNYDVICESSFTPTQVGKYKTKTMMVNQPTTTQINQEFRNKAPLWKVKNIKNRFLQKKI